MKKIVIFILFSIFTSHVMADVSVPPRPSQCPSVSSIKEKGFSTIENIKHIDHVALYFNYGYKGASQVDQYDTNAVWKVFAGREEDILNDAPNTNYIRDTESGLDVANEVISTTTDSIPYSPVHVPLLPVYVPLLNAWRCVYEPNTPAGIVVAITPPPKLLTDHSEMVQPVHGK